MARASSLQLFGTRFFGTSIRPKPRSPTGWFLKDLRNSHSASKPRILTFASDGLDSSVGPLVVSIGLARPNFVIPSDSLPQNLKLNSPDILLLSKQELSDPKICHNSQIRQNYSQVIQDSFDLVVSRELTPEELEPRLDVCGSLN